MMSPKSYCLVRMTAEARSEGGRQRAVSVLAAFV